MDPGKRRRRWPVSAFILLLYTLLVISCMWFNPYAAPGYFSPFDDKLFVPSMFLSALASVPLWLAWLLWMRGALRRIRKQIPEERSRHIAPLALFALIIALACNFALASTALFAIQKHWPSKHFSEVRALVTERRVVEATINAASDHYFVKLEGANNAQFAGELSVTQEEFEEAVPHWTEVRVEVGTSPLGLRTVRAYQLINSGTRGLLSNPPSSS